MFGNLFKALGRLALLVIVVIVAIKLAGGSGERKAQTTTDREAALSTMPPAVTAPELTARAEANRMPMPDTPSRAKQDLSTVVYKITKDAYPKTYQKWGKAGVDRINGLMLPAAKLVSESPRCRSIDYMGLSDDRSTKNNVVFFVDCAGTERFYVDEAQIKGQRLAASENQKAEQVSDANLLQACKDQIRVRLNFPSTFDPGWFGTSVYRAPAGRTVATIDFEAKNSLGAALPHRGKCFMEGSQITAVEIAPR